MRFAEGKMEGSGADMLTRRGRWFVALWSAGVLILYALGGYAGVRQLRLYRSGTEMVRRAATGAAPGQAERPPFVGGAGKKPVDVATGIYIDRIEDLSTDRWAADFDIWFRWKGGDIDPGKDSRS